MTRKWRKKSRWSGYGERYSDARTLDVVYWERDARGKMKLTEETLKETEYCAQFAHEKPGFFRGARVHRC